LDDDDDDDADTRSVWKSIRENIKASEKDSIGYYEMKQHKPWFDDDCSKI
jgi:hypothetical protein